MLLLQSGCTRNSQPAESPPPIPPKLAAEVHQASNEQSQALLHAKVTVIRVYLYTGRSEIQFGKDARLVAVEARFEGYGERFDPNEVELLDGESGDSYGTDPEVSLAGDATDSPLDRSALPPPPGPLTVRLVYPAAKMASSIKLAYWGMLLTAEATRISE
jgi:hypothetical protein